MRLVSLAATVAVLLACAAVPAAAAAERPLVYVVSIDGLDGDRVDDGKAPYISSLLAGQQGARATYYQESRALLIAETNPNHVAMVTGAYIDRSGTAGNGYGVYFPVEENTCIPTGPRDLTKLPALTSGEDASCLLAETVFEAIKRQGNPDRLVTAAIFGKPKLGAIFAGDKVREGQRDVDYLWAPCSSSLERDDGYCDPDVQRNPATGYAIDDGVVMDEVLRTIDDGIEVGDRNVRPDFTFVNLHQVDSAGHAFTPNAAYDTAIGMADEEIRRLVDTLKAQGVWERSVVILVSDHSMDATLNKTMLGDVIEDSGVDPDRFTVIGNGSAAMIYLADRTDPNRFELLKRIRAAAVGWPSVGEALYRESNPADGGAAHTIDGVHPGWHAAGERTGDLLVMHRPGGAFLDTGESSNPINDVAPAVPGQHGAPQTRDSFFAVIGGGEFVRQQHLTGVRAPDLDDTLDNPHQAENVDPAATVMGLLGMREPSHNAGRFLSEAFFLRALPGRARPADRPRLRVKRVNRRRGAGCRVRTFRARFGPPGGTFRMRLVGRGRARTIARSTTRTRARFRVREGRRRAVAVRMQAASGVWSKPTRRRIDLRRACRPR